MTNKTSNDNKIYKTSLPQNVYQQKNITNSNSNQINNNKNNLNHNQNNFSKQIFNSNCLQNNKTNFNRAQVLQKNMHFQNGNIYNSKIRQNRENQNKKFDDLFRMNDDFIEEDDTDNRYVKYLSSINRRLSHGIRYNNDDESDSNSVVEANFEQIEREEMYTAKIGEREDYYEELREKNMKKKGI